MSIFTKILGSKAVETVTNSISPIIDNLTTSDDEKSNAKTQLTSIVLNSLVQIAESQKQVIIQEMKGNWLQKSWRPLMMLTFGAILVCKWFGITDSTIPQNLELELMSIIKIGLGGYVVGRSVEKVSDSVTKNIDIPFIKKKNRDI